MRTKKWDAFLKEHHSDEEIEKTDREAMEELKLLDLQRLRKLSGQTQAEIAAKMHVTQAELSRVERRSNPTLETLQRVIEAIGGEMRIVVQLKNETYTLKGAWAETEIPAPEVIDAHRKRKTSGRRHQAGH